MILGSIIGFLSGQGLCVDDAGYSTGAALQSAAIVHDATMWAAVQSAMMLWQRHTNSKIADIRRDLANRRMAMAEVAFQHASGAWAAEKILVTEVMATVKYVPEYSPTLAAADAVERAWLETDAEFDRMSTRLGISVTDNDDVRTSRGMALAITDIMASTMRGAEARALALNDRRFSQQLSVLALGRDKLTTAVKIGQLGETSANSVRNAFIDAVNLGMSTWGYEENRFRGAALQNWRNRFSWTERIAPVETRSVTTEPLQINMPPVEVTVNAVTTDTAMTNTADETNYYIG